MLWLTRQSLKRPSITIMITVILIVFGIVSAGGLKQELFPDISFPVVTITTIYPGAASETMDQDVAAVIEKAVASVPGVQGVQSTASESFSFTVLQFDVEVDPKEAKANVQEAINSIKLPENAQTPKIGTFDFNSLPIVIASVSGNNLSDVQARVTNDLVPAISGIAGVNNVAITGGAQDKVIVTLDPAKMTEYNLSQAQVVQFLQANNLAFPVGTIEDGGRSLPLRITHKYSSTAEIENVVVGIKGVNLSGGSGFGGSGFGSGMGATQPTARPTVSATPAVSPTPTAPVTSTNPVSSTLIPAQMQAAGITSPEQITPQVIAQIPDAGLSQISLPLALALSPESKTALANRLPAPQVPPQMQAAGITKPEQIQPAVISRIPVEQAKLFPVNLALAMPEASQTALAQLLASSTPAAPTATPSATPTTGGSVPPEFAAFGITSPEQITPEVIDQVPAQYLSVFTPELVAQLSPESQAALAKRLNNPDQAAGLPEDLLIRLNEVGTVKVGTVDSNTISRTNGEPSINLQISRDTTGNTVEIVDAIKAEFDKFNTSGDLKIQVVNEQGSPVTKAVSAVVTEGLIGAVVAVLVIFLFLWSFSSTLVTAVSIPLSILVAVILMRFQGYSLNVITLGGLTVAVGRVVDDSIVVLENIFRHLNRGENRRLSVINGTKEVAEAITASTITTVCVFLPLGFVGGIVSKFFLPFALTVTYALLASLVVALTVVPLLAYLFLRPKRQQAEKVTWLQKMYLPSLKWALRSKATKAITLLVAVGALIGSLALIPLLGFVFLPDTSEKLVSIKIEMPAGTSLEGTTAKVDEIEKILLQKRADGQIRDIQTSIGTSGGQRGQDVTGGANAANRAQFSLTLQDKNVANPQAFAKELETLVKGVGGLESATAEIVTQGGPPLAAGVDVTLVGSDINKLREANDKIMAEIGGNKASDRFAVANVKSDLAEVKPELEVSVDPDKAIASGTTTAQIALQIRALLTGENAGTVQLADQNRPLDIFVQFDRADFNIDTLKKLKVGTVNPVPLESVATIKEVPGATTIVRINGDRATSIRGQFTDENTFEAQSAIEAEINRIGLPEGVRIQTGAQAQSQIDTVKDMSLALLIALVLVYLVMTITFGSLLNPLIILVSVLLAPIGVFGALLIGGKPLSITVMIAMLMLIGIVVTNAIVLIELVEQYRERGMNAYDALIRAGSTRLRPILMTAVATMVALLPLAMGLKEGGFIGADLGLAVIGGLFTSTFLTLLVVPVLYSIFDSIKTKFGFTGGHHDDDETLEPIKPASDPSDEPAEPVLVA